MAFYIGPFIGPESSAVNQFMPQFDKTFILMDATNYLSYRYVNNSIWSNEKNKNILRHMQRHLRRNICTYIVFNSYFFSKSPWLSGLPLIAKLRLFLLAVFFSTSPIHTTRLKSNSINVSPKQSVFHNAIKTAS